MGIDWMIALRTDSLYRNREGVPQRPVASTHPERVIRIWTDPAYTKAVPWEGIEKGTPELGESTHRILAGKQFYYIANSGWGQFNDDGTIDPKVPASAPIVRHITLE